MYKLQERIKNQQVILIDGAMGTEILRHGLSTELPLWSAEALLTHPLVVEQIHESYIRAGAEIIVTNTFCTTQRVLDKDIKGKHNARKVTILACDLARMARQKTKTSHKVYIAGSVSPLEDCYSPELTPAEAELAFEHKEMARNLRDGAVDFVLIETMITLRETLAAIKAVQAFELPFAVSFCCNNKLELLGGETLSNVVSVVEAYKPLFLGVNCVSPAIATKAIKHLRTITKIPISVYAQGDGHPNDDQGWKFDDKDYHSSYLESAKQWLEDGAQLIGGCCGTSPQDIYSLQLLMDKNLIK